MKPVCHRTWRASSFFAGVLAIAVTGAWHEGATLVQPSRQLDGRLHSLDWRRRTALVVRQARKFDDDEAEARKARKAEKRKRAEETNYRSKKQTGFSAYTLEELQGFLEALQINTKRVDMSDKRAVIKKLLKLGAKPGDFADIGKARFRYTEEASGSGHAQDSWAKDDPFEAREKGTVWREVRPLANTAVSAESFMARVLQDGWRPQDLTVQTAQVLLDVPTPSPEAVRAAKRRLALKWHPDVNTEHPKAADAFALIMRAADLLS
eukprot:TRINITY_DN106191_c0_g1_i1.p1 TRINITY_DN106191_c0_g1~~TRINITY_DN106191_c0_g1_i1.p1  ORF type:complete len:265 (-),score=55.00 TRINITY_DN106191_c0_g1_i1:226-1020(-)